MVTYSVHLTSPKPPEEVFGYLARFSTAAEWDPGVIAAAPLTAGAPRLGARYRLTVKAFGREVPLEYRITEFEPPRRVVLSAENTSLRSVDVVEVTAAEGGGSYLTYRATLTLHGAGLIFMPLLGVAFRRIGDRAAAGLRRALSC
ncbi:MAG: SRPBCC family protein [Acidimicrobiales bacterium]